MFYHKPDYVYDHILLILIQDKQILNRHVMDDDQTDHHVLQLQYHRLH